MLDFLQKKIKGMKTETVFVPRVIQKKRSLNKQAQFFLMNKNYK
jgi:hypothetical protein